MSRFEQRVLVTGATGFIGGAVARQLQRQGYQVTATGRNRQRGAALMAAGIRFQPADLADGPAVVALCRGQGAVIHCGGLSAPWGRFWDFYRANVQGTGHVLQGCQRHQVARLVYLSTPSIYFDYQDRWEVREEAPLPARPLNGYVSSKLWAEWLVRRAGVPFVIVRPRAVFGPGDTALFPRLIQAIERGRLRVVGEGHNWVDLSYIDNVVQGVLACLTGSASIEGRAFNLSNGQPMQLWPLLTDLCHKLGYPAPTGQIPYSVALGGATLLEWAYRLTGQQQEPPLTRYGVTVLAKSQTVNIDAARQDLGYTPQIDIETGLTRFLAWWLKQQVDY